MKVNISDSKEGEKKINVIVTVSEQKKYLDQASTKISNDKPVDGFRPGKAPREQVERAYGEMAVMEQALDAIVNDTYYQAIKENNIQTVGKPKIDVKKVVPGNDLEYDAEVALLPNVTLGELDQIKVKIDEVKVTDKDIDEVLKDLQNSRAKEVLVDRTAKMNDKVELDFEVKLNQVVIEGGSGKKYPLVLGTNMFIPGFEEKVVGMKKGDTKEFNLTLPANYKPDLAGKEAQVEVKLLDVFERQLPKIDDELASAAGNYKDVKDLKEQIKDNLKADKQAKADQKLEVSILEQLVKLSDFSAIPQILIDNEVHKMEHEMEQNLQQYNITLTQYLERLSKTKEDLTKDWQEQAKQRVQSALVARELAEVKKIEATPEEIKTETEKMKVAYQGNEEVRKNIETDDFREYLFHTLTNKKVIDYLKQEVTKK